MPDNEKMIICIDSEYFNLSSGKSRGLVSSLKKLSSRGYKICCTGNVDISLKQIINNEDIDIIMGNDCSNPNINKEEFANISVAVESYLSSIRHAVRVRETKETKISIEVFLDRPGSSSIKTGIGFFDHMLEQIARHGNISLNISVDGDLFIDEHHTVEDTGIALGEALLQALGDKRGIKRYGYCLPMDDADAQVFIDLGGRPFLNYTAKFKREKVGDFPTELVEEFFRGISSGMRSNISITATGRNEHHKIEAIFKAFAKALNEAARYDERADGLLPSTKGAL